MNMAEASLYRLLKVMRKLQYPTGIAWRVSVSGSRIRNILKRNMQEKQTGIRIIMSRLSKFCVSIKKIILNEWVVIR